MTDNTERPAGRRTVDPRLRIALPPDPGTTIHFGGEEPFATWFRYYRGKRFTWWQRWMFRFWFGLTIENLNEKGGR